MNLPQAGAGLIRAERLPNPKGRKPGKLLRADHRHRGMSGNELAAELERGGRFVIIQYCISLIFVTFLRASNIYFLRAGERASQHSSGFSLFSAILRGWGIPWGPIDTIQAVAANAKGGLDGTANAVSAAGAMIVAPQSEGPRIEALRHGLFATSPHRDAEAFASTSLRASATSAGLW